MLRPLNFHYGAEQNPVILGPLCECGALMATIRKKKSRGVANGKAKFRPQFFFLLVVRKKKSKLNQN